ncbi:hypothetical protein LguiB_006696 [Lonicera macranthoides]
MENKASESLSLKIVVEKEKNKLLFVESNKDFIDILFSFMVLPFATVSRLTRKCSLRGEIGCLKNLYESIENLDLEFVESKKCKSIMLYPRSAAGIYCRNLKQNLTEGTGDMYYACPSSDCNFVSYYQTRSCRCWNALTAKLDISVANFLTKERGGFVKSTVRFMISDNFEVKPMPTMTGITLLMSKLGEMDGKTIEERTVTVGRDELLKLLKCSLTLRTPFSDTFLGPSSTKTCYKIPHGIYGPRSKDKLLKVKNTASKVKMISLKLIVSKSSNRAIYAEANEDFFNLLCSFLTVPLGCVFKGFPSLPFRGCVNNLYKSIENIEIKLFESYEVKETLVDPKLAPGLAYNKQLLGTEEAINPSRSTLNLPFMAVRTELSPGSQLMGMVNIGEGLIKGPSVFIIPFVDIEEREVTLGEDEILGDTTLIQGDMFGVKLSQSKNNEKLGSSILKETKPLRRHLEVRTPPPSGPASKDKICCTLGAPRCAAPGQGKEVLAEAFDNVWLSFCYREANK